MAQDTDAAAIAEQQTAMQRFSWMLGTWRGPGSGFTEAGPYQVTQTERIGPMLAGTLIVIEGKGFSAEGETAFNAFGIISYDVPTRTYRLRSYALGYTGDFRLTPTEDGYTWEIPAGPGAAIRYTAKLADGIWTETGDYVAAGQPPSRIFEMNLERVGDSSWPEAGGVPKD
jgi:hypothetical protein